MQNIYVKTNTLHFTTLLLQETNKDIFNWVLESEIKSELKLDNLRKLSRSTIVF